MSADLRYASIALGAVAVITVGVAYSLRSRRKTPDQRERERRTRLREMGRIIDGTVSDAIELDAASAGHERGMDLIIYRYDVAGVTYEASQDVTTLRPDVDLHSCRLGLPCSVRYDPHNPADSIVIAEAWSGLRAGNVVQPGKGFAKQPLSAEPSRKHIPERVQ